MTREEVAEVMGITPERVRQIEKGAMAKLRRWSEREQHPLMFVAYQHYKDIIDG